MFLGIVWDIVFRVVKRVEGRDGRIRVFGRELLGVYVVVIYYCGYFVVLFIVLFI